MCVIGIGPAKLIVGQRWGGAGKEVLQLPAPSLIAEEDIKLAVFSKP
ncbi:MAG TPA: hypothetical protein VM120_01790 [Bryobacteraceae bacterium]|nr:hypothetical protein [Bryobacteraceae bacterium]